MNGLIYGFGRCETQNKDLFCRDDDVMEELVIDQLAIAELQRYRGQ